MSIAHTVGRGETLSSIARQYKLKSWKEIYFHPDNKKFCDMRRNQNLIFPGDVVMIPDASAGPKAAVTLGPLLICDSKADAVAILKTSTVLDANTKALLSPGLVTGILAAEAKRLNLLERAGVDEDTQGPGQIGKSAYDRVLEKLRPELDQFLVHMGTDCGASPPKPIAYNPIMLKGYPQDVIVDPVVVDFFIAAYLAICIMDAAKPGRSADDQLQFGIGRYKGGRGKMATAQAAISPHDSGASVLDFLPVKNQLENSSDREDRDVAAYVDEVFQCRSFCP
jgi:hypothetical protein